MCASRSFNTQKIEVEIVLQASAFHLEAGKKKRVKNYGMTPSFISINTVDDSCMWLTESWAACVCLLAYKGCKWSLLTGGTMNPLSFQASVDKQVWSEDFALKESLIKVWTDLSTNRQHVKGRSGFFFIHGKIRWGSKYSHTEKGFFKSTCGKIQQLV